MASEFGKDIMARARSRAEIGAKHLTDGEIKKLNNFERDMLKDLGVEMGVEWSNPIPNTAGVPKIFIMQPNERGEDQMTSLEAAGIKPGSAEFWSQMQMGNIFAYPVGSSDPVQMQVDTEKLTVNYSKPITEENLPQAPASRPTLWMRFAGLFGAYKKERTAWAKREENKQNTQSKLGFMREQRTVAIGKDGSVEKASAEKMLKSYDDENDLIASQKASRAHLKKMDLMTSIYQPQPRLIEKDGILKNPDHTYALYSREQFNDLKQYPKDGPDGIDLNKIKIGNSGESVSPEEFASVCMYALWQPGPAMKGYKHNSISVDQYAEESILNYKDPMDPSKKAFKPEEVHDLMTINGRNFYTGDLFIDPPRDNEGSQFKDVTNEGRRLTVEAFQDYAKGDKRKLAKLIADGINKAPEEMRMIDSPDIQPMQEAVVETSTKLLGLMDKDPELRAEVEKQGMDPEKLKVVQGIKTLQKMQREAAEAEVRLAQIKKSGEEISAEEKQRLTRTILKPKLAMTKIAAENMAGQDSPEIQTLQGSLFMDASQLRVNGKRITKVDYDEWKKHPEKRPRPNPGQIYLDTAQTVLKSIVKMKTPDPKELKALSDPKAEKALDKLADNIIKQEGLAEKSPDWLYKEFNHAQGSPQIKLADSINKVAQNVYNIGKEEPQPKVSNVIKQPSVAERAKQFEGNDKKPQVISGPST